MRGFVGEDRVIQGGLDLAADAGRSMVLLAVMWRNRTDHP